MAAPRVWNFTLVDSSPMFKYLPLSTGFDASTGWQSVYDNTTGDTYHSTRLVNATVTLSFFGTGITLFGSSNASLEAFLDKENLTNQLNPQEGVLFQLLPPTKPKKQSVQLKVHSASESQILTFRGANVTSEAVGKSPTPQIAHQSSGAMSTKTKGSWRNKSDSNSFHLTPQSNATVRATSKPGDIMSFSFNGRAVAIYGPVNKTSGLFSASHDDTVHVINASSPITLTDTLLYYEDGLDETNTTTLSLTNLGEGYTAFCVTRAEVVSFNSTDPFPAAWVSSPNSNTQKETHIGIIIGPIIGVLILIATICGLYIVRSRRRSGARSFGRNAPADVRVTPFEIEKESTDTNTDANLKKELPLSLPPLPSSPPGRNGAAPEHAIAAEAVIPMPLVAALASQSTVERLLQLISHQIDVSGRPEGELRRNSTLPPYPTASRGPSFRTING